MIPWQSREPAAAVPARGLIPASRLLVAQGTGRQPQAGRVLSGSGKSRGKAFGVLGTQDLF